MNSLRFPENVAQNLTTKIRKIKGLTKQAGRQEVYFGCTGKILFFVEMTESFQQPPLAEKI